MHTDPDGAGSPKDRSSAPGPALTSEHALDPAATGRPAPRMVREQERMGDGRMIIYYSFEDSLDE